jgi:hypothetical protein
MTPKEKAQDLYFKFYSEILSLRDEPAKQCALIAVDEILDELYYTESTKYGTIFWNKVKQEIEKL